MSFRSVHQTIALIGNAFPWNASPVYSTPLLRALNAAPNPNDRPVTEDSGLDGRSGVFQFEGCFRERRDAVHSNGGQRPGIHTTSNLNAIPGSFSSHALAGSECLTQIFEGCGCQGMAILYPVNGAYYSVRNA